MTSGAHAGPLLPREPLWLKKQLLDLRKDGGIAASFGIEGSIGLGSLWSGARLRELLKPFGVSWPQFQGLCGDHSYLITDWLEGKIAWESMCQTLVEQAMMRKKQVRPDGR